MCVFVCTVCQNKISESCSTCNCKILGIVEMIEDTTKLYDKSFLCEHFNHVRNKNKENCKKKKRYGSLEKAQQAKNALAKYQQKYMRIYKCDICRQYHLTTVKQGY